MAVRTAEGDAIVPGFALADSEPLSADGLRLPVRWRQADLGALARKTVCFEFELDHTDLFAFEIGP